MSPATTRDELEVTKLELDVHTANCYVVACRRTREAIIIDTPAEPERILSAAEDLKVRYIVITHTHADHLGAFSEVRAGLGAPVAVHHLEAGDLPSPPDWELADGDRIAFGRVALQVLHTPGHTPGSICLLGGGHLISGDSLFPGGPGHTRTPAAFQEIVASLVAKLFVLPDDTLVHPGHGPDTVLGKEKQEFSLFSQHGHDPGLCGDVLWLAS